MVTYKLLRDIEKTRKPLISIKAFPVEGDWFKSLELKASKFGGAPYVPSDRDYPHSQDGKPLHLLAQINLKDLPRNELLPTKGLLQFFITDDNSYGYNNEKGVQVIYISPEDLNKKASSLDFLIPPSSQFPILKPHSLSFFSASRPLSLTNPNFEKTFNEYMIESEKNGEDDFEFYDLYALLINHFTAFQIGGYPSFVQGGPSYLTPKDYDDYEVLLQMGDDEFDINPYVAFGDAGIATFLISKADLKNLDFSRVIYHWGCY